MLELYGEEYLNLWEDVKKGKYKLKVKYLGGAHTEEIFYFNGEYYLASCLDNKYSYDKTNVKKLLTMFLHPDVKYKSFNCNKKVREIIKKHEEGFELKDKNSNKRYYFSKYGLKIRGDGSFTANLLSYPNLLCEFLLEFIGKPYNFEYIPVEFY